LPGRLGNSIPTNFRKEFYKFFSFETAEIDDIIVFKIHTRKFKVLGVYH